MAAPSSGSVEMNTTSNNNIMNIGVNALSSYLTFEDLTVTGGISVNNLETYIYHTTQINLNSIVNLPQLTASQIVETDANKNLLSVAKGTAYNKNFGTGTTNIPEIGSTLGNSQTVETDSNGKLITATIKKSYSVVSQYFSNDFTTLANLSAFSITNPNSTWAISGGF